MIVNRDQVRWIFATTAIAAGSLFGYLVYTMISANGPRGGSWPGLAFGFAGTGIIVFECLLSLRKRYPASPIGRLSTWLRAHVWLGSLSFILILLHAGFRFGGGLSALIMWLFLIITLSGVFGLAMQNWLPRVMLERLGKETVYDQIPHVVAQLRLEADERVEFVTADLGIDEEAEEFQQAGGVKQYFDPAQKGSAREKVMAVVAQRKAQAQIETDEDAIRVLKAHYLQEIRPFLHAVPAASARKLFATREVLAAYFEFLRKALPVATHPVVHDLQDICEERRQLILQRRLHHWLHGWLYLHVPLSMAFLILTLVHAVVSLRY